MMKVVRSLLVLLTIFLAKNLALDAENYTAFIDERSRDENFVNEYTKWSLKLLSQPGYLFGMSHGNFTCSINKSNDNNTIPTSVHTLRPSDIKCIGAMGDSFTTGLAMRGTTLIDLLVEDRGLSWSIGGDYTYSQIATIPNILRKYNSTLKGFSTKEDVLSVNRRSTPNDQLNVAKSGSRSDDMLTQAEHLIPLLQNNSICDWKNDWKLITIFVGANDLCHFCDNSDENSRTPEQYQENIRVALDKLYNASIPRTLINLVLPPDVRGFKEYTNNNSICQTFLQKICPCAAFPTTEQAKILDDYILRYQELLENLTNSGRYDGRDDFTVVIQPFMAKTQLPIQDNRTIDFSYLSPDCFHFSGKGHSQAAMSLWNNMLQPVGIKQKTWAINQPLKCPTEAYPYIFTSKNSAKALEELKRNNTNQPITNSTSSTNKTDDSASSNSTDNFTYTNATDTLQPNGTSISNSSNPSHNTHVNRTAPHRPKPHKDRPSKKSDSSFSKTKVVVIGGFLIILIAIVIIGLKKQATSIVGPRDIMTQNSGKFNRLQESDDDFDVYTRPNTSKPEHSDNQITNTHGARMPLD